MKESAMRMLKPVLETGILMMALMAGGSFAEEGEEGAPPKATTIYVKMEPAFVTNYGSPRTNKLKYVKAEVTLRVSSAAAEAAISRHMPYLRNEMVMLLSSQTEQSMASGEAQEMVRKEALKGVNRILKTEEETEQVEDLLFTNFIVQR